MGKNDLTYGFIGCGNMGGAIIRGMLASGYTTPANIMASAHSQKHLEVLSQECGIHTTLSNTEIAANGDVIVLAIKPYQFDEVLSQIASYIKPNALIVSIAAGISLAKLASFFHEPRKLFRAMPNTPVLVLEGMTSVSKNEYATEEDCQLILDMFTSCGSCVEVKESLIDTVIGVSGSSPAYIYMIIEAMADAAVLDGMTRDDAYTFAAQAVLGAAKMVLSTKVHPGVLKDQVCSPGGTTIAAVAKLEETGLRNSIITAQRCCVQKSKDMLQ